MRRVPACGGEGMYRLGEGADGDASLDACRRVLELRAQGSLRGGEGVSETLEDAADETSPAVVPATLLLVFLEQKECGFTAED